jgi:hypothetical protein
MRRLSVFPVAIVLALIARTALSAAAPTNHVLIEFGRGLDVKSVKVRSGSGGGATRGTHASQVRPGTVADWPGVTFRLRGRRDLTPCVVVEVRRNQVKPVKCSSRIDSPGRMA